MTNQQLRSWSRNSLYFIKYKEELNGMGKAHLVTYHEHTKGQ